MPADDLFVSKQGAINITSNEILLTEYTYVNIIKDNRVSNFKMDMK